MQIDWFFLVAIFTALAVAVFYRSQLRELMRATREDFKRRSKASAKQDHDLQSLSAKNLELQGEVERLRAKLTGLPAQVEDYKTKLRDSVRVAAGLAEQRTAAAEKQRQGTEALGRLEQQLVQVRAGQDVSEKAREQLKVDVKKSTLRSETLQLKLAEEHQRSEAKLDEASKAVRDEHQSRRDGLAELLFLQHHFGEAGLVARRHWQSADPHEFSKEPFEHEADLALSISPDDGAAGACCEHLAAAAQDEHEPRTGTV